MKAIIKTRKFDINLKTPYATYYTAVAEDKARVIELLEAELSKDNAHTIEDFEIEDCGIATDQMGRYFKESLTKEIDY